MLIQNVWKSVAAFFSLPDDVKERHQRISGENFGWVPSLMERYYTKLFSNKENTSAL